jgi:hypothetical protein
MLSVLARALGVQRFDIARGAVPRRRMSSLFVASAVSAVSFAVTVILLSASLATAATNPSGTRTYELVSPNDRGGYATFFNAATPDGDAAFWTVLGETANVEPDGGALASANGDIVRSRRDTPGWATTWVSPTPPLGQREYETVVKFMKGSDDGERVLFPSLGSLVAEDTDDQVDLYMGSPAGVELITHGTPAQFLAFGANVAATSDFQVVLFKTADPVLPSDADALDDLYAWTPTGLEHVSIGQDGADPGTTPAAGSVSESPLLTNGAVSEDGRTVFFTSGDALVPEDTNGFVDLYARLTAPDGSHEVRQLCSSPAIGTQFMGATPDGRFAFIRTNASLLPEDTDTNRDIYRVTVEDGTLAMVSGSGTPSTTIGEGNLVAFSADGGRAVFLTGVQLDPTDEDAATAPSGRSLYLWDEAGTREYVSPIAANTTGGGGFEWSTSNWRIGLNPARMSADGSVLAFRTQARATPDDTDSQPDVFVYRDGALTRVSQGSAGGNAEIPSELGSRLVQNQYRQLAAEGGGSLGNWQGRSLAQDGSRVFFTTAEGLVPGDVNSKVDVYEYGPAGIELISTGTAPADAIFYDADETGRDVFFGSGASLDGSFSGVPLIYDARIGGGAFPTSPLPEDCADDGCQGPTTESPRPPVAGSDTFWGSGNVAAGARAALRTRALSARQRNRLARGASVRLAVNVSRAGFVTVSGWAKVAGRRKLVARGSTVAKRAGVVHVRVRLAKAGREQLALSKRLHLQLTVRLSGAAEPRVLHLRLARPSIRNSR